MRLNLVRHLPCTSSLILLFIFFASISASGQYRPAYLLHQTFAQKFASIDSFRDVSNKMDINEALKLQDSLIRWSNDNNDPELAYFFLISKFQLTLKKNSPAIRENTVRHLSSLINTLDKKGFKYLKIHGMQVLADYHWHVAKDFSTAITCYLQAYYLYNPLPSSEYPARFTYTYRLAEKHYAFRDYKQTIRLLNDAKNFEPKYREPGMHNIYNLLGLCYRDMEVYDSAEYYFKAAALVIDKPNKIVWPAIINGNIGITYYMQDRYEEAIPLLENDIFYCLENRRAVENATKSMAILADIYLNKNNPVKAMNLLEVAKKTIESENIWHRYDILVFVYPVMAKAYHLLQQETLAYAYSDSALRVKDALARQRDALLLAGATHFVEAERHLSEIEKLNNEKKIQLLERNALLAGIVLALGLTLLFINRQKIQYRRKQESLEAEKRIVATELANATSELEMFTRSIHEKNELIEKFTAEIENIHSSTTPTKDMGQREEILKQLQESTILTDEEWEHFRTLFEKVHGGYLLRLREKYPMLSPAETRFLALSKLKLSNKEMAGVLGITQDAVRMSRHRLRKKLALSEELTIDELVDAV